MLKVLELVAGLALVALALAIPAHAETRFGPAFPGVPLQRQENAKGAIIWNHGSTTYYTSVGDPHTTRIPSFVYTLALQGWDVFRLDRDPYNDLYREGADALVGVVAALKKAGYRRIVLAGQSAGAWISLIAAGQSPDVYAVIALAPAYYGVDDKRFMNASALYDYLGEVQHARVLLAFFQGDPYDPGGRGPKSDKILTERGLPHLVIDQPAGLSGHLAAYQPRFDDLFHACLLAMVEDAPVPSLAACAR